MAITSVGDVVAGFRAALGVLGKLRQHIHLATDHARRGRDQLASLGGGHHLLRQSIAQFEASAQRLREADALLAASGNAVEEYLTIIGAASSGIPPAIEGATGIDQRSPSHAPYVSRFFDALPVRQQRNEPTRGVLTTVSGQHVQDVSSKRHPPNMDLKQPWRGAFIRDHAEAEAAALMRQRKMRQATLYVNNIPCGDELGCDQSLPAMLPQGYRLTVYGPDGWVKSYDGTGEAVIQ